MDTINALHNTFKEASSELQISQDRVSRLEQELGQYQLYQKTLADEEKNVANEIIHFKGLITKEQMELEEYEVSHHNKLLQLDLLNTKIAVFPTIICEKVDQATVKQRKEILSLEQTLQYTITPKNTENASQTGADIIQTKRLIQLLKEEQVRTSHKMTQCLQATLEEEKDTLQLLEACIGGMIRKNQQIKSIDGPDGLDRRPEQSSPRHQKQANSCFPQQQQQHQHQQQNLDKQDVHPYPHPHRQRQQHERQQQEHTYCRPSVASPLYPIPPPATRPVSPPLPAPSPSSSYYQHATSTTAPPYCSATDERIPITEYEPHKQGKRPLQLQLEPPWYMFNKKKQKMLNTPSSGVITSSSSSSSSSSRSMRDGTVTTNTNTKTKKTFRSGNEILELELKLQHQQHQQEVWEQEQEQQEQQREQQHIERAYTGCSSSGSGSGGGGGDLVCCWTVERELQAEADASSFYE